MHINNCTGDAYTPYTPHMDTTLLPRNNSMRIQHWMWHHMSTVRGPAT